MHGGDIAALAILVGGCAAVFGPLMRGIALRIARGGGGADDGRVQRLEAELGIATSRLSATEAELARTAEKVDFLEKLLARPAGAAPSLGRGLAD
jgi:hypothetical protein